MEMCESVDPLLPLFVSGTLESAEQQRLAAHLAACEPCREELGRLFRLQSELKETAARLAPSPAQLDRVFARLHEALALDAPDSKRFDLSERVPFAEHVQPLIWTQRLIAQAERLRNREWTFQVRLHHFAVTPGRFKGPGLVPTVRLPSRHAAQ